MITLAIFALIGVALALLEWRRPAPRPALRALLAFLTAAALGGLAGHPERRGTRGPDLILETPSATPAELDSARRLVPSARLLGLADVRSPTDLRAAAGSGRVVIAGDGPPSWWWPALEGMRITVLPAAGAAAPGFASLEAATQVRLGDAWRIRGRVAGASAAWVSAVGPDQQRDSSQTDASGRFELTVRPRAAGSWAWRLASGAHRASLGVAVAPRQPSTVLLLASAPTFELTALKRRLAERGDRVLVRVRSSKERVVTEYVNLPQSSAVPRLDAARWRSADHVVVLGSMTDALAPEERAGLLREVRDGLGVIRIIRTAKELGDPAEADHLVPGALVTAEGSDSGAGDGTARVRTIAKSSPVPVADARFAAASGIVLRDASDRPLAMVRVVGEGRVVGSLVTDAARWRTVGDTASFDGYWRTLFDATLRPSRETPWQADGDARIAAGAVVTFSRLAATGDTAMSTIEIAGPDGVRDSAAVITGADDAARRVFAYVPRRAGWHRIVDRDSSRTAGAFLVQTDPVDPAQRAADARASALRHAGPSRLTEAGSSAPQRTSEPLLPDAAWLILAAVAAGLLWLLQRRDG